MRVLAALPLLVVSLGKGCTGKTVRHASPDSLLLPSVWAVDFPPPHAVDTPHVAAAAAAIPYSSSSSDSSSSCHNPSGRWRSRGQELLIPGPSVPCAAAAVADTAAAAADTAAEAAATEASTVASGDPLPATAQAIEGALAAKGAEGAAAAAAAENSSSSSGGWMSSFLQHLAYAAAAQSAAMSGSSLLGPFSLPASSAAAAPAAAAPAAAAPAAASTVQTAAAAAAGEEGWSWRAAVKAFFARVDERLEEGGPALYSEVYDFTL
ncbi:hypothetical protein Efla_006827 [Eimeria flavescens]